MDRNDRLESAEVAWWVLEVTSLGELFALTEYDDAEEVLTPVARAELDVVLADRLHDVGLVNDQGFVAFEGETGR